MLTIPSGVLKINKGTFSFDEDYFFNITEASEGHNLFRAYYMGGTTFILSMYPGTNSNATFGVDADRFAVIDVATQSFEWVSNFPVAEGGEDDPFYVGSPYIDTENQQLLVPVTLSSGEHYLYIIDPEEAIAEQSSQVIAESVKAVGILAVNED